MPLPATHRIFNTMQGYAEQSPSAQKLIRNNDVRQRETFSLKPSADFAEFFVFFAEIATEAAFFAKDLHHHDGDECGKNK